MIGERGATGPEPAAVEFTRALGEVEVEEGQDIR
jgi:hypothetical protein